MPATVPARPTTRTRRSAPASSEDVVASFHHAATVQDRIRQWQTSGSVALPPDAVSAVSAPRSAISDIMSNLELTQEDLEESRTEARAEQRGRESRRLADIEREEWIRKGRASTPRKRVVSDEHWRKKTTSATKIEPRSKLHSQRAEPDVEPDVDPDMAAPYHKSNGSASKARAEREERRRRRTEARRRRAETRKEEDDKVVCDTMSPNSFMLDPSSELVDGNDADSNTRQRSEQNPDEEDLQPDSWGNANSVLEEENGEKAGVWSASKYATTLGRPPPYEQHDAMRSKKSMLNKTKEMLGMNDPSARVSNRLPSIEAWLDEQPDPFQDDEEYAKTPDYLEEVDIPKPLKTASRRRQEKRTKHEVADPNKIWDSIGRHRSEGTPLSSKVRTPSERTQREADLSPAALRRRGAKSSRMKRRAPTEKLFHEPVNENDSSTQRAFSPPRDSGQQRDTCSPVQPEIAEQTVNDSQFTLHKNPSCSLKRKLTTHEDLMSQLSLVKPKRSTRRSRGTGEMDGKSDEEVIRQILDTVKDEEAKYGPELRTLVDGVIPVLLQCVLSKSDSATTAALFMSIAETGLDFARSVVDMGIALERLKSLHKRIPLNNADSLVSWSQTAHKAYSDYLGAWRLGFQEVIVNLAPLAGEQDQLDDTIARDDSGDMVDSEGEKVDVAYLLKRPLVRIRKLSKALCALRQRLKQHPVISKITDDFLDLEAQTKQKYKQEQGRIEDAAAASIDTSKVRDIRTFGTLSGVELDRTRKVRARDTFSMTIHHSTGQRIDSRIELILRDNKQPHMAGGDLLICHVDKDGKWLLFAPVEIGYASARRGESGCDLVIMIRGAADLRSEWHELLALNAEDPEAVADWMNMLGSNPLPPKLSRIPSFAVIEHTAAADELPAAHLTMSNLQKVASVETFDVPLGEPSIIEAVPPKTQARGRAKTGAEQVEKHAHTAPRLNFGGALQPKSIPEHWHHQHRAPQSQKTQNAQSPDPSLLSEYGKTSTTRSGASSPASPALPRPIPHKQVQFAPSIAPSSETASITPPASRYPPQASQMKSPPTPASPVAHDLSNFGDETASSCGSEHSTPKGRQERVLSQIDVQESFSIRDGHHQTVSPAPSGEVPPISKTRHAEARKSLSSIPLTDSIRDTWAALSGRGKKSASTPNSPVKKKRPTSQSGDFKVLSPPIQPRNDFAPSVVSSGPAQSTVLTEHSLASAQRSQSVPISQVSEKSSRPSKQIAPLSSSPLKHEYAPSTTSESPADEDDFDYSDDASSDTSEDLFSELKDEARSLPDMARTDRRSLSKEPSDRPSAPTTTGTRTLAPSDSASQGPYRRVPSSTAYPREKTERAVATICSWSDKGMWEPIRNDDCAVVVSPGLIEAFAMEDHVQTSEFHTAQPLVAFELTPLVPLRKGTALDITIRSPPTAHSQVKTTNNVMFRSRSMMECENLYRMINWARCNNPTYIELERARPRPQPEVRFSNQEAPRARSWFSFGSGPRRRNSFRAGSVPPPSMPDSVASSGTVFNALSTLKRLSKTSAFSINRSSVIRRPGRGTNASLYSSDTNTVSGSGSSTPAPPTQLGFAPGKDGPNVPSTSAEAVNGAGMVNNMKMKLYLREGHDWTELGPSQLSVLPAPRMTATTPSASRPGSSSGATPPASAAPSRRDSGITARREYRLPSSSYTPHRIHGDGREKRVVVTKINRPDVVLLDEILGESCFEKVAERGIAIKVWTEDEAMRTQGGVLTGRGRVYMMKFKSQSEASWVFGLCGTYRYSTATTA